MLACIKRLNLTDQQGVLRPDNVMVLMMTTLEDTTSFEVFVKTTTYKEKQVLKLVQAVKYAQNS